ncbi:MAG TPA: LuxR C-terminal-related transcriptional regulator, partial [Tepidisphaeraceae bacterium]|nr:LuxR C-terminal-related transcriptional regulator [Tepidisphaeraceae bacterium]
PRNPGSPLKRHQVLNLWLKGYETRQIAQAMNVHPCTINTHLRYLCRDHNVPTRAALARTLNRQSTPSTSTNEIACYPFT